jgi:type I restriction enzyme, S subunit
MGNQQLEVLKNVIKTANTGLDAIKRAPIVDYDTGIKCLRIQDVSQSKNYKDWGFTEVEENNFKRYKLINDDIIVARTGASVGVNKIINGNLNSVFNNGLIRIRTDPNKCIPKYLHYNFRSSRFDRFMDSISGGTSTQPNIQINALLSFEIAIPPLSEQIAIASVLSSLDDKIDLLHRQNKTLEAMAETLFRQWFVEDAEDDWEESTLDSIANYINGIACQKFPPKNNVEKLPVLKIKELSGGISENSDWATSEVKSQYIIYNGDIIFSWSGSLQVKVWDGEKCVLNQHLFKVTSEDYQKWFIYLWTKFHLRKFIAIAESKATTMGHIKRKDLSQALVIIPDKERLKEMDLIIQPLLDKLISNNKQLSKLEKLRDTLLPKLMSGEVRVEYKN